MAGIDNKKPQIAPLFIKQTAGTLNHFVLNWVKRKQQHKVLKKKGLTSTNPFSAGGVGDS